MRPASGASPLLRTGGRVVEARSGALLCRGLGPSVRLGEGCWITKRRGEIDGDRLPGELVQLRGDAVTVLPYDDLQGLELGAEVELDAELGVVRADPSWLGRVVDALGRPADGGPALPATAKPRPLVAQALPAAERGGLGPRLDLGVRALDLFAPCRLGQRLGVFAGSGVGKSSVMAMVARASAADVLVIGLIGERGRELHDFVHETLTPAARARSVVVAAASDLPAMMRRRAALLTLTIAEALRDAGLNVLCLLDSVTRYAMALREIHLAAGEPPTTKGYPPSVFSELPRLLERAGPGRNGEAGSITGLFTVLVDGDDTNEPIADAVRGILDGHVVLDRGIAERGRYPAIDVLRSLSRSTPGCYAPEQRPLVAKARRLMAAHAGMAELIQLGAYTKGGDPVLDEAMLRLPALEGLLAQAVDEPSDGATAFAGLAAALGLPAPPP